MARSTRRGCSGARCQSRVEIGFGGGEHLAAQAAARPNTGFVGCEPFLNGVVQALGHLAEGGQENVRLHMGDALDVVERLPDASVSRVYLLHPDPWPKARHAKRRMVNDGPLDLLAAKLMPGAEFPAGHRRPDLLPLVDDGDGPARRLRVDGADGRGLPDPPRRLAGNPLRAQGAAAGT